MTYCCCPSSFHFSLDSLHERRKEKGGKWVSSDDVEGVEGVGQGLVLLLRCEEGNEENTLTKGCVYLMSRL